MKTVAVIISGAPAGENLREVDIEPGTSAGDVLRALNLTGYILSREGSAQAFAAEEDIYGAVEQGGKVRCTPIAEVGAGFWDWLVGAFAPPAQQSPATQPPPQSHRAVVRTANLCVPKSGDRLRVNRDRRALWEIRGWTRIGNRLRGAFRTPTGSFVGEIFLKGKQPEFYIQNPPQALLSGGHSACFRSRGNGRYFIHFGIGNPDVDSGLVAVEKLISAALRGGRR
jgi:hypothetical protein